LIPAGHVFVIAEAGVNHNGSLDLAHQLVDEARAAGADAVKFQTFRAERLVTRTARKAEYQRRTTGGEDAQYSMLKRLELGEDDHRALLAHCQDAGIMFLSSPFDEASADMLDELGVAAFKIPSGEITNPALLRHVAEKGRPVILSTGMSTLSEVEDAVGVIREAGDPELSLLHCVTEYPAPVAEVNLRAMHTLRQAFSLPVGYSDHTPGIEIAVAAVALDAVIIEKHFTLSRGMEGPDHLASLEPAELSAMVQAIKNVEAALGDGIKRPAPCELKNVAIARKSVVAERRVLTGQQLTVGDIAVKRPGDGIPPRNIGAVIGRRAARDIEEGQAITWEDLEEA
jgi:N,N'-diacetyllegionaminate synthase